MLLFTQERNESQNILLKNLSNKVNHFSGISEKSNNLIIQKNKPISTTPNKVQNICKPISSIILNFFFLFFFRIPNNNHWINKSLKGLFINIFNFVIILF